MSLSALYELPAPAKLNLFLHVVGRRPDGYHLLQSLFVLIDWADWLHLERRDDGRIVRHDLGLPLPADDLCLRAARLLQTASGCGDGVDLSIDKRVPWGAGLGGGSSDAATTLIGLNRLWRLGWPRTRLAELALQLGADVPFFIGGRPAFVEGIGERMTPLDLPACWYAVVKPLAAVSTAAVFGSPMLGRDTEPVILTGSFADASASEPTAEHEVGPEAGQPVVRGGGWGGVQGGVPRCGSDWLDGFGRNDLQPVAEQQCSEVADAAAWLLSRFGNSRMTGSGSAVFARVGAGDHPVATFPSDELPAGWVGRLCRSLSGHPLAGWTG